jgi:hypothetical protein
MPCGRESRPGCVSALRVGHGVPRRLAVSSRLKNGQPPAVLLLRKPQVGAPWPAHVLQPLESGCPDSSFPAAPPSVPLPQRACCVCACHQPALSASDRTLSLSCQRACVAGFSVCVSCNRPALVLFSELLYIGTKVFPRRVLQESERPWMLLALLHPASPAPVQLLRHACTPQKHARPRVRVHQHALGTAHRPACSAPAPPRQPRRQPAPGQRALAHCV